MTGVTSTVLLDQPVRTAGGRARIAVRYPWYRSMALSTIESVGVRVDGVAVPPDRVVLELGGRRHTVRELAELWQESWFLQDAATLDVPVGPWGPPGDLGPTVEVTVDLVLRVPYLRTGPDSVLRLEVSETRRLAVVPGGLAPGGLAPGAVASGAT